MACAVARKGRLALIKWIVGTFGSVVDDAAARQSVHGGHLEMLRWIYRERQRGDNGVVVSAERLFSRSLVTDAKSGHLEMV